MGAIPQAPSLAPDTGEDMRRKTTKRKVTRRVTRSVQVMVTRTIVQCERPYVLFGEELRRQRLLKDWTQQQLGDSIGLSRASIANIEVGRQRIYVGDLLSFASALGIRPRLFFDAVSE